MQDIHHKNLGFCLLALLSALLPAGRAGAVDFNHDIRPILAENCFKCHGFDPAARKAGLRLDVAEGPARKLKSGNIAIIPGKPNESELLKRITNPDKDEVMPPPETGKKLTSEQIELLKKWIAEGGVYAKHWSFERPVKAPQPAVKLAAWPRNSIDYFVLARLEHEGLSPSPEASPRTLARRAALDITGLPPSQEELDAFLQDASPQAYEHFVDRLLASPAYGEHWGRRWLDLARYADTNGYEKDRRRTIWPFRDWVINALNADMPYDQFTREQLAGDLLPNPTQNQLLATAFHRNTLTNEEGGVDKEEYRVAAVKDRVDTTMQVWMGLTMGCAKCHSHKYDPIAQREYYEFYAFFNETEDANRGDEFPTLPTPTPEETHRIDGLTKSVAEAERALETPDAMLVAAEQKWEEGSKASPDALKKLPKNIRKISEQASDQSTAQKQEMWKYFVAIAPQLQAKRDELAKLKAKLAAAKPTATPIMRELPEGKRRETRLQIRGNFLDPADKVDPGLPEAFPPLPAGAPKNRLGVAQWLCSRENPLTARVAANRIWAGLFGTGIVETQEDFGTQGTPPTHPELLDWMAVDLMDQGWSLKKLLKTIVLSATYRQSSHVSPELAERDRFNHRLARGPRFRLEAEVIRDESLAVSGLLSRKMFGPSVMPYQPPGMWKSTYSSDQWQTSPGEDQFRRGLYTFIKRTTPYPSMITFDGTSRETCTVRRARTNTPLQALVTLNDPVFVQCAQALARKMAAIGGESPESQIAFGLKTALLREPQPQEITVLVNLYRERLKVYERDAHAAEKLATVPLGPLPVGSNVSRAAALTSIANVILNLDEFLTKG